MTPTAMKPACGSQIFISIDPSQQSVIISFEQISTPYHYTALELMLHRCTLGKDNRQWDNSIVVA